MRLIHGLFHSANGGSKLAAVFLIIVGIFTAPMLIGIPIIIVGFFMLLKP